MCYGLQNNLLGHVNQIVSQQIEFIYTVTYLTELIDYLRNNDFCLITLDTLTYNVAVQT